MNENETVTTESRHESAPKQTEPRTSRSIRFADLEWAGIQKEASARGMTAAELVRHAAVGLCAGKLAPPAQPFPPEIVAQIERVYRGVYLLSTLKRDEMFREGRQEEYERIRESAKDSQVAMLNEASKASL